MSQLWMTYGSVRPAGRGLLRMATQHKAVLPTMLQRFYAAGSTAVLEERVMDVLKSFDKVDQNKISMDAHFINDLGLDSLDTVELVMAFEDEFALEIPDEAAEKIFTARDAVKYVEQQENAH
eukprot:Clim_evm15s207 gene=Clim_evmTU15s207